MSKKEVLLSISIQSDDAAKSFAKTFIESFHKTLLSQRDTQKKNMMEQIFQNVCLNDCFVKDCLLKIAKLQQKRQKLTKELMELNSKMEMIINEYLS